jgi:hypothetical protein
VLIVEFGLKIGENLGLISAIACFCSRIDSQAVSWRLN